MATEVLKLLGWEPYRTVRAANKFRAHNVKLIHEMYKVREDQELLTSTAKQARADLEKMFTGEHRVEEDDEGWDLHPQGR
jgi:glutathione-regulated potassium-efflux system ancillary protein KefC